MLITEKFKIENFFSHLSNIFFSRKFKAFTKKVNKIENHPLILMFLNKIFWYQKSCFKNDLTDLVNL